MEKSMTLRLPADQAEELEAVALADGVPVAEAVRRAIASHIEERRQDEEFQKRLADSMERNKRILEKLAAR